MKHLTPEDWARKREEWLKKPQYDRAAMCVNLMLTLDPDWMPLIAKAVEDIMQADVTHPLFTEEEMKEWTNSPSPSASRTYTSPKSHKWHSGTG